ncbi:MAG TPA: phosphatidate cytidylyltransferase [Hyphomicrobium sp.]
MSDNMAATQTDRGGRLTLSENLKLRVISGAILAAIAFGLAYAGPKPFGVLVLVVALFVSWEWGRMVRGVGADVAFFVHAFAVTAAIGLAMAGYAALGAAVLVTAAIILVPLVFGHGARLSALGVFYVGLPAISLLWLRSSEPYGFAAVMLVFVIVWCSDIGAYAAGRLIGGPRLWPKVSPNKTWAGLIGGLSAGTAAAALLAPLLVNEASPLRLALIGLGLSLVAQGGDLAESALKRLFGRKDASELIPGHGGFMDRMDSVVAVAVAAGLFALILDPRSPARALLFGV